MSEQQRKHILKSLDTGIRYDGRKSEEYRKIDIEYGVSETAEGSAKITIGDTTIIAGVKLSLEKPYEDNPDEGNLMIGAEFLPIASPDFEVGPPSIDAIELARVTDRGIREGHAMDTKSLCVKKGEQVWVVSVDICIINDAGNLYDAASLATLAALKDTKYPEVVDGVVDYKHSTDKHLELAHLPIGVTVVKIGEHLLVDPLSEEMKNLDARLTVTVLEDGQICALQKGGETPLNQEEIANMLELAISKTQELRKYLE